MGPRVKKKKSKIVDFNLWGNHTTTQTHIWNWNIFFGVLAHCEILSEYNYQSYSQIFLEPHSASKSVKKVQLLEVALFSSKD